MRFQKLYFLFLATLSLGFASCASEYHWVKVQSKNPVLVKKMDNPSQSQYLIPQDPENTTGANPGPIADLSAEKIRDHGFASIHSDAIKAKAKEIENSISLERKAALFSNNKQIQGQAIKETLHEQLIQNSSFAKLSVSKQNKIETKLAEKVAKKSSPYRGNHSVNSLLVLGLVLLLVSLLFISSGSVYAVIGVLFSVILIILGLVQGIF